jgi:hypothetical protein
MSVLNGKNAILSKTVTRRAVLALGGVTAVGGAALAVGIGCDSGPDNKSTPPTATAEAVPTPTPELGDRPLMIPQEIQAPAELTEQLRRELGENTEVLHYYQGEYIRFGFLMDPRLRTRTTKTTDFGFARFDLGQVTTLSDFKLSDENLQRYTGQTMPIGELVKRMENVFLLLTVNEMRDEPEFQDVFPAFDPATDPFDLKALAQIKDLIRTRKEPKGVVQKAFTDPSADRFLKFENDNPGGIIAGGFGYGRKTLEGDKYKGGEVIQDWIQILFDEADRIAFYQERVNKGLNPPSIMPLIAKSHYWTEELVNSDLSAILPTISSAYLREKRLTRQIVNGSEVNPIWTPYEHQLLVKPRVPNEQSAISVFSYNNSSR